MRKKLYPDYLRQSTIEAFSDSSTESLHRPISYPDSEYKASIEMNNPEQDNIRSIEDGFPIGFVSKIAEHESWRKEVYRPLSYTHKWWARRLGSVFRAVIISSIVPEGEDINKLFYSNSQYPNITVYDPFLGSGTTVIESLKLGCRSIGRDINPVPVRSLKAALKDCSLERLNREFSRISRTAGKEIIELYSTILEDGSKADVLYYFWVKVTNCPACGNEVELFKTRIFSKHAYPQKVPSAKSICPDCGSINDVRFDAIETKCSECNEQYNPQLGSVRGSTVTCPNCQKSFKLLDAIRKTDTPLKQKMYAKMVLDSRGTKRYLSIDAQDTDSLAKSDDIVFKNREFIPRESILPGHNTNQIMNHNYLYWNQMFNQRQLASLTILAREIHNIQDKDIREIFTVLFSGILEFNNMFASFKGEGTGAVRHMFSNHILKPELMPLEANVWGTAKSSGSFSTLYESRLLRAMNYKAKPFELSLINTEGAGVSADKIFDLSPPIDIQIALDFDQFDENHRAYLSIGDSAHTDIKSQSVDLVITDPPFFDNVHYSELADFFYVWQNRILRENVGESTRAEGEVQCTDSSDFSNKLGLVFSECHRVLKDRGLLVFTYHHSRPDGWSSVYKAVREACFSISNTHPVKAEMEVSIPIMSSKSPISYDLIIVCRKDTIMEHHSIEIKMLLNTSIMETKHKIANLSNSGLNLSMGDIKVILMGSILSELSKIGDAQIELDQLDKILPSVDKYVSEIVEGNEV